MSEEINEGAAGWKLCKKTISTFGGGIMSTRMEIGLVHTETEKTSQDAHGHQ